MSDDNIDRGLKTREYGTLNPQVSERDNLAFIADMEKAGIPDEVVQAHIKDLGLEGKYDQSPSAQATRALDVLKSDPAWIAKVNGGDAEANAEFNRLTYAMAIDPGPDVPPVAPSDYKLPTRHPVLDANPELAERFQVETRQWASELALPVAVASAVTEFHLDHAAKVAGMGRDELENFGRNEERQFLNVVERQGDAKAQLTAAEAALAKQSNGRKFDLAAVARSSGARCALELLIQGQMLAARQS